MAILTGMEKFNHLEDKLYRIVEQVKKIRQEKEDLEKELFSIKHDIGSRSEEVQRLKHQVENMMNERDTIKLKVEAMLDAIALVDTEVVEVAVKKVVVQG